MSIQQQRDRGRPTGSVAAIHRVRKDYRFSQQTLDHIAQGRALTDDAFNETAFVEQAIAHYTAFLAGEIQNQTQVNQEMVHLQAQIANLERDLSRTQHALRLAETRVNHQSASSQLAPTARTSSRKPLYQILVRHDPGVCPALPAGHNFLYTQESDQPCPVHQVFVAACAIDQARQRVAVLKQVPGFTRIWLTKNGYDTPQDDWQRKDSTWQRTE